VNPRRRIPLKVQFLVEAMLPGRADHLLDGCEPERRKRSELGGERVDFSVESIVLDGFPDQPPFGGSLSRQRLAGQCEPHGACLPHQARQGPGAAAVGD
jgi:hypothetical protein